MPSAVHDMMWVLGIAGVLVLLAGLHDKTAAAAKIAAGTALLLGVAATVVIYDLIARGAL